MIEAVVWERAGENAKSILGLDLGSGDIGDYVCRQLMWVYTYGDIAYFCALRFVHCNCL